MCRRTGTADGREHPNLQRGSGSSISSHPTAAPHSTQGNSQGQSRKREGGEDDGEVHAQVQGRRGRRGGRHGGHAGRRRPDQVQGRRRRQADQEAAAAVATQGRQRCRCRCGVSGRWPDRRELLPQAAQPHALHGATAAVHRRRPRSTGARLRPLPLLQHGVLGGRLVARAARQDPAVPLRRRRGGQRQRSAGIGERQRQLGERPPRPPPREEGDDAVEPPPPRRVERPGVGSGGAKRQPLAAVSVDDVCPTPGGREGEDAGGGGDRRVLRGGRGGRGQALRVQVQLRRRPRRAALRRPLRVVPGGDQHLASQPLKASACKGVGEKLL